MIRKTIDKTSKTRTQTTKHLVIFIAMEYFSFIKFIVNFNTLAYVPLQLGHLVLLKYAFGNCLQRRGLAAVWVFVAVSAR